MNAEEAIEKIKSCTRCIHCTDENGCIGDRECFMAKEMAISALEKQIPKNPVPDEIYKMNRYCPNCEVFLVGKIGKKYSYCPECGQAIDYVDAD